MFTGSVMVCWVVLLAMGEKTMRLSVLGSLMLVSFLGTFIQFLAFTDYIIKKMRYSGRLILFVLLFLPMLTACALGFQWFPREMAGGWMTFLTIFLLILLVCTAGFEIYLYVTGRKYDGLLGQYKKQKEKSE